MTTPRPALRFFDPARIDTATAAREFLGDFADPFDGLTRAAWLARGADARYAAVIHGMYPESHPPRDRPGGLAPLHYSVWAESDAVLGHAHCGNVNDAAVWMPPACRHEIAPGWVTDEADSTLPDLLRASGWLAGKLSWIPRDVPHLAFTSDEFDRVGAFPPPPQGEVRSHVVLTPAWSPHRLRDITARAAAFVALTRLTPEQRAGLHDVRAVGGDPAMWAALAASSHDEYVGRNILRESTPAPHPSPAYLKRTLGVSGR